MNRPQVAILTKVPLSDWAEAVVEGVNRQGGLPVIVEEPEQLSTSEWDAGWLRMVPGPVSATAPGHWQAAEQLELEGTPLLNSTSSHLRAYDKLLAGDLFEKAGLETPQSWAMPESAETELPYPLICKPVTASRGFGVVEVMSYEQALEHQAQVGSRCMLQEKIATVRCIRAVSTPDQTIRIYEKQVDPGVLVASIALGAKRVGVDHSGEMSALSEKMVAAVGGGLMGSDLLEDRDGKLWALEVNASFAFDAQDKATADFFARAILDKANYS